MALPSIMPFRVDYWPANHPGVFQRMGRVDTLSATHCTILTHANPTPGTLMELRLHLGDSDWPLRAACARVLWAHGDAFTVEFLELSARDAGRLRVYLARCQFPGTSFRGRALLRRMTG